MTITSLSSSSSSSVSCSLSPRRKPPAATFHHHGLLSMAYLSRTRNNDQNQQLTLVALQLSNRILVQCNSANTRNSPTYLAADLDVTLFSFFREIGIDEREAELILEKNPALRLKPLNSVRARVQSLKQIRINGFVLGSLVLKHPDLLTAAEVDSLISFVRDDLENKIDPSQLERLLYTTEPRFYVGFEKKVKLLLHFGIPKDKIGHVLNNVILAKALCFKSMEEIERTITFLKRYGGVNLIVQRPAILNCDLERQIIPRVGYLTDLSGGDEVATGTVLRKLPAILAYREDHLKDHVEFLRSFAGLTYQEIFKIVLVYPNLFSTSRRRKLHPRIEFLKECGLNSNDIFKFLIKAPIYVSLSFEGNLARKLVFLVKIGYENRTKDLVMAMGATTRTSSKNLQEVIGLFLNYGLSCDDILAMSKKHPQILQYSHVSLEEKMDYLVEEMGRDIGELLSFPAFLGYKFDSRIKLRYEEKKKILGEGMSLNKLLSVSTERFSSEKEKRKKAKEL